MKYTIDLTMAILFVSFAAVLIALAFSSPVTPGYKEATAEIECAKNNGVPIINSWTNKMVDCKIYLQK